MSNHSRLLIDEPPLVVQKTLARIIGLNQAMVLQQLHYHAGKLEDDEIWVTRTIDEWHDDFPFWSRKTIRRALTELDESLKLVTKNPSKSWNRALSYKVNYEEIMAIDVHMQVDKLTTSKGTECPHASGQIDHIRCGQNVHMSLENKSTTTPSNDSSVQDKNPCGHQTEYQPSSNLVTRLKMDGIEVTQADIDYFNNYLSGLDPLPRSIPNTFKNWMVVERHKRMNETVGGTARGNKLWQMSDDELVAECRKVKITTSGRSRQELIDKLRVQHD